MGCSKGSSKRKVYSNRGGLPQEARKISNEQPNLPPKGIIKRRTKPKVRRGNSNELPE